MTDRFALERGATLFRRKEAYPHLVCSWSLDPASHRLSCMWAPPEGRRGLAVLAWSPRIVPGDAILISEPA